MRNRFPAPAYRAVSDEMLLQRPFLDAVHRVVTRELPELLTAVATWDPPSVASGATASVLFDDVAGAALGHPVMVGFSRPLPAGAFVVGSVSAPSQVRVTLVNQTGAALDLPSGTLRVCVWAY